MNNHRMFKYKNLVNTFQANQNSIQSKLNLNKF